MKGITSALDQLADGNVLALFIDLPLQEVPLRILADSCPALPRRYVRASCDLAGEVLSGE